MYACPSIAVRPEFGRGRDSNGVLADARHFDGESLNAEGLSANPIVRIMQGTPS